MTSVNRNKPQYKKRHFKKVKHAHISQEIPQGIIPVYIPEVKGEMFKNGDELLGAMQADLMPHVHAVRHLLPLLQDNVHARRYVMIGSPANAKPWAGYGETSVTTAALRMYAQVVHQEAQALGVRAQMLEVCSPVCTPANAANACIEWPSSLLVGRRVVSLLDGCRDNRAIVRCDSSDAELPRGLLHLDVPPLWRDTAGIA